MNSLDRIIGWFSPRAGLQRVRARVAIEAVTKLSYEGARSGRRLGGWSATGTSANSEIGTALSTLRQNSRDMVRNNAFARKAAREWGKKVVGTGIVAQSRTGLQTADTTIDTLWDRWGTECVSDRKVNWGAAEKLICRTVFESGECIVRMWRRKSEDKLAVPFQIQILEPDYLDISKTQTLPSGYIIQGVQFDGIGRVQGYWLYGNHPGEVIQTSARGLTSAFVPVADVLHIAEIERPGQVRGVPRLAAVMAKLRDIDEYADAEIVRKKIAACLAGFVTQSEEGEGRPIAPTKTDGTDRIETFRPGMIEYLKPGEEITIAEPKGDGSYAEYKKTELREVAAGIDIPYVILAEDLSDTNYSSYRGGLLGFREAIENEQWNVLIPLALDPIRRRFIDVLIDMGVIPEPSEGYDPYGVEWHPPAFDLLDREAEAKADDLMLTHGTMTWPQAVGRRGYDPEKQIAEIAEWKPRLDAAGVMFGKQGGQPNAGTQPQAQ